MSELRPGYGASTDYNLSEILASAERLIVRSITLAKNNGILAKGTVLGKVTSGGKFAPAGYIMTSALATSATHIDVASTRGMVAGDVLTVQSSTGTPFTITLGIITSDLIAQITASSGGAASGDVIDSNDGSETAACILADQVDTTTYDVVTEAYFGGVFKSASLIGLSAAAIADLNGHSVDNIFSF